MEEKGLVIARSDSLKYRIMYWQIIRPSWEVFGVKWKISNLIKSFHVNYYPSKISFKIWIKIC